MESSRPYEYMTGGTKLHVTLVCETYDKTGLTVWWRPEGEVLVFQRAFIDTPSASDEPDPSVETSLPIPADLGQEPLLKMLANAGLEPHKLPTDRGVSEVAVVFEHYTYRFCFAGKRLAEVVMTSRSK
jgi:hypothetical protein